MRIAVHAFDGITLFHLAAPLLVFGEVVRARVAPDWEVLTWTADGGGVVTAEGPRISDVHGPEALDGADVLVFPSWPGGLPPAGPAVVDQVRRAHDRGAIVVGLCLGAFPVVDAGLLDGRSAVTHWAAVDDLRARRPQVQVEPAALYLDHGDVMTSAGTASSLDACLHLVRTRLGAETAATISRLLVVAPHRDGDQAQYVERPVVEAGDVGHIGPTLAWARAHVADALGPADLATHAHMSRRNFDRRFAEVTGTTPARWLTTVRLDHARRLLERTDWPVTRVASESGWSNVVTFRQRFGAAFSTSPTSYRRRFSTVGPDADDA